MPTASPSTRSTTRRAKGNRRPPARLRRTNGDGRPPAGVLGAYLEQSRTPLASLVFVLPLLVLHEIGVQFYATLPGQVIEYRVTAFALMVRFFDSFGATGRYLPALAVVAILVSWHVARGDQWVFNSSVAAGMGVESLILAFPLVGVYFLVSPTSLTYLPVGEWKLMASLYLGAGVYEELVFRLAGFSVLSFLMLDVARISRSVAIPVTILLSAGIFAFYHMLGTAEYPFPALVFVALRGVYYGVIFLERGFGVTVGVHTTYDLLFLALRELHAPAQKLFSSTQMG